METDLGILFSFVRKYGSPAEWTEKVFLEYEEKMSNFYSSDMRNFCASLD